MNRLQLAGIAVLMAPLLALAHDDGAALRRSITVSGQGEVSAAPDRARLNLVVESLKPEVRQAQDEVNRVVRAYLAEIKTLDIKDADIATAGLTIQPEYAWDEKLQNNRLRGYRARRTIDLLVRDLDQVGDFLLRATKVGVNNVSSPVLESSKATELGRQALVKATEDARAKAALLSSTLGVKLGAIHSLNAAENVAPPPYPMMMMKGADMAQAETGNQQMGFTAGEIKFNATVNADFDLVP